MSLYDIELQRTDGSATSLREHKDHVVLVVNVASRCGLTPQYAALEALQRRYGDRGFTVLAFPSNQFLQELSTDEKVVEFCSSTYGVTFPVLARVKVNGRHAHPLYRELKEAADADGHRGRVRWNFEKFLLLPGEDVRRFAPSTEPDDPAVVGLIEANLPR